MVQHPAWIEYFKEFGDPTNPTRSLGEDRKWFEDHGWYTSSGDIRTDGIPDEEVFCGECEGGGEIISEIELIKAITEMGLFRL